MQSVVLLTIFIYIAALRGAATLKARLQKGLGATTFPLVEEKCDEGKEANMVWFSAISKLQPLTTEAQSPNYMGDDCHNTTQQALRSAYKTNLNITLSWLSSDAATRKGYNYTRIGNNDAVYGLYDCRGNVVGYFCQFCVSMAAREIPQCCPNRVFAVIWFDFCILRYSNENFIGKLTIDPVWKIVGKKNISNPIEFQKGEDNMRSLVRKATDETNQLLYMSEFNLNSTQRRYGEVQCSRDLTNAKCKQCLEFKVNGVCSDIPAWPGREKEDISENRAYFGIKTADRKYQLG